MSLSVSPGSPCPPLPVLNPSTHHAPCGRACGSCSARVLGTNCGPGTCTHYSLAQRCPPTVCEVAVSLRRS